MWAKTEAALNYTLLPPWLPDQSMRLHPLYQRLSLPRVALLHKDRKYGNNKRVAQETYSKGRDE